MDAVEENNDFRGFTMSEIGKGEDFEDCLDNGSDEVKEENKETLPNGTEEETTVKETEPENEKEDDEEEEEEEEEGEGEGEGDTPEKVEENNESRPEDDIDSEEKQSTDEPARKRLRSTSSRSLSEKENDDEKEGDDEGFSSSDGEDFLGFDLPDNSEKEDIIRALIDEQESIDSSDSGTPVVKSQTRNKKIDRSSWKKPVNVDLSKPEYKKPFEFGWVRELVYRSTSDSSLRRNADIYYFTPKGKKVRSFREVAEHLTADLTIDNFTFFKGPIGIGDPDKEIIREAKVKPSFRASEDGFLSSPARKVTPKLKATATPKTGGKGSPPETGSNSKGNITPRVVFKPNSTPKIKTSTIKTKLGIKDKKRRSAGPDDLEMGMLPPTSWSPEPKKHTAREVCSIECQQAMGLIPTLQCQICLCLYHPECVGLLEARHRPIHSYVCKSCQLNKVNSGNKSSQVLPPAPPTLSCIPTVAPRVPKPMTPPKRDNKLVTTPRSQSIVGAVTTWLPPSSSIQVSQPAATAKTPPTPSTTTAPSDGVPQTIVSMNRKQYVVVAKHNVVNVMNENTTNPSKPIQNESQGTNVIPTSGALVVSGQSQSITSPPGVLLVPYTVQQGSTNSDPNAIQPAQYVIMNNAPTTQPNLIIGNLNQPVANVPFVQSSLPQTTATQTNGVERGSNSPVESTSPPPEKKPKLKENLPSGSSYPVTQNFMMNLNAGFLALLHAFQYLKVHELLRASCVSHMWRHIASHRSLWETVHMKNSRVRDWEGFGKALRSSGTRSLDLKKMLLPEAQEAIVEMWSNLSKAVSEVPTLRRIDLGRCIPEAIENVAKGCPQLESITALSIRGTQLDVQPFATCSRLVELRLKSLGGIELQNLKALKTLTELKHLSLTTIKSLIDIEEILGEKLETLELGECSSLSDIMATEALAKLTNLKRIRLEKGQSPGCPTTSLLNTVSTLPNLTQLELINFDIKPGFDKALAKCTNLRTLLIIPTYVTQSATTNHVVMGGVSKLSNTLTYFVWGLTLELLRVTDLFIDQVEGQKGKLLQQNQPIQQPPQPQVPKKGSGDSIPILKPIVEEGGEGTKEGQTASQVDILALPKLQKVLSTLLPSTKIKILKVPFSATWRQTISEMPQ